MRLTALQILTRSSDYLLIVKLNGCLKFLLQILQIFTCKWFSNHSLGFQRKRNEAIVCSQDLKNEAILRWLVHVNFLDLHRNRERFQHQTLQSSEKNPAIRQKKKKIKKNKKIKMKKRYLVKLSKNSMQRKNVKNGVKTRSKIISTQLMSWFVLKRKL